MFAMLLLLSLKQKAKVTGVFGSRGYEFTMAGRHGSKAASGGVATGERNRGSWLQIQSRCSERTGNGFRLKLPKLSSNDTLPPEPLQTVPPTQEQGFKYLILWGEAFSLR